MQTIHQIISNIYCTVYIVHCMHTVAEIWQQNFKKIMMHLNKALIRRIGQCDIYLFINCE